MLCLLCASRQAVQCNHGCIVVHPIDLEPSQNSTFWWSLLTFWKRLVLPSLDAMPNAWVSSFSHLVFAGHVSNTCSAVSLHPCSIGTLYLDHDVWLLLVSNSIRGSICRTPKVQQFCLFSESQKEIILRDLSPAEFRCVKAIFLFYTFFCFIRQTILKPNTIWKVCKR